jgi:hypothetical protein
MAQRLPVSCWELRQVPFKFQLSDWSLGSLSLRLQMMSIPLGELPAAALPLPPDVPLGEGSQGFFVRAMPLESGQPVFSKAGPFLCYIPLQYQHCYIDLRQSFDDYKAKFSSKTRSTITRKVKRWADYCGGAVHWKTFKTPDEMEEFFALARAVSLTTYQERLLEAGLPDTAEYLVEMQRLAALDRARGYILFDAGRPVSYLYCPVSNGVLIYAHLGYDPQYLKMSVGTVLQWLALESLFSEGRFRLFDFTEGQSDHKRLFATHAVPSANVVFVRRSPMNLFVVYAHEMFSRASAGLGQTLDRLGWKKAVKRLLRSGR